ncbi:MAG: UvrD-helicase domain-containing protein [Patescibacteria group bacterium]|nr:UvrD-helicase domain-containing protein [Patescibacteria group bacterium]MDD5490444.1 UvrD-helicase domain-containing protein [Patescibacteria group bacterium]
MEDILARLNKEQKEAVTYDGGPLLIVAGAGTGKTTVITSRIAWLINEAKAKPEEILALTFTDKAAGEMEERVDRLLPYGYVDLWISTFHSFAERILKQHAIDIGLPNDFKLLNKTEQWLLVRQNLDKFDLDYYRPLGNPTKFIHALLKHFSRAKDEVVSPVDYLKYAENIELDKDSKDQGEERSRLLEIANAYHIYERLLLENNALDFGDLINYTLKLFRERKAILEKYQKQFKYILVDEFQDTNWAQYELVKLLARENLAVVGDDDQSIYKFRGASVSNIMQFKSDFPAAKEVVLTNNYRSAQNILDLSYGFIKQNNPNRLEASLGIDKKLKANIKESGLIEHYHGRDLDEEVKWIIKKIVELKNNNKHLSWSDFAVLVRANDSANIFIREMIKTRIPYQFVAMRGLYGKPIILDCLAYFKLLDNYHESPALWRILNLPFFDIDAADLVELNFEAQKKSESLFEVLKRASGINSLQPATAGKLSKVLNLIAKHSSLVKEKRVSEMFILFLKESGYLEYLNHSGQTAGEEERSREALGYLQQFYKKITVFEADFPDPKLKDFEKFLELEMESGEEGELNFDPDAGPEMVKIMTVHSAKGLEFEYVFIPNLVDRKFPTTERQDPIELPDALVKEKIPEGDMHLEEERRLFYVAMTRAKKGLYFTSALDYGGARKKKLSRFLIELRYKEKEVREKEADNFAEDEKTAGDVKKHKYILPGKFSFTQLAAFQNCPLQYKFAHILRIPVLGKAQFSFGKTMHATLEKFLKLFMERSGAKQKDLFSDSKASGAKSLPDKEELLKIYQEEWDDSWYNGKAEKEKYRKIGEEILTDFHRILTEKNPRIKFLEQPFNIKFGDFTLKGQIDRIDEVEGGVEIIDYKTGQPKEKLEANDKRQLLIYQIAAEEVLKLKPQKLTYYYLNANKEMSFVGTEKDLIKTREEIISEIEKIKKSDFSPTPELHTCKYCDFKDICEFKANGA